MLACCACRCFWDVAWLCCCENANARCCVCCGNGCGGDGAMCAIVVDENRGDAVVSAALCWCWLL